MVCYSNMEIDENMVEKHLPGNSVLLFVFLVTKVFDRRLFNGCLFLIFFVMEEVLYQNTFSLNKVLHSRKLTWIPKIMVWKR